MRVVLLALLMLAVTPAAAEWVKVSEIDGATFYIDPATLRKDGNLRRMWHVTDLKARNPEGVLSRRSLNEYDCKEETYRLLSLSQHSGPMATGNTLATNNYTNDPWAHIAPDTVAERLLRLVCAK